MSPERNRAVRLNQIMALLHKHPAGLTTHEMAARCNTTVRTIQRDLLILQSDMHLPLIRKSRDRYVISSEHVLPPVSFSKPETVVLFLAARLLVRQTDKNNPYVISALQKLFSLMPAPLATQLDRSVKSLGKRSSHRHEQQIFKTVATAWTAQKRLRLVYHSMHRGQIERWLVNPYFMEMTGVGFSIYLIGQAENAGRSELYTFKLNRIKSAEILDESFEFPPDLRLDEMLASSWGVMQGKSVQVKLKFTPAVTPRVKESAWHSSHELEDCPDGGCLLTLTVSNTLEMTPWLRGWGPDVEVLEPAELRTQFKGWAQRLWQMYQ